MGAESCRGAWLLGHGPERARSCWSEWLLGSVAAWAPGYLGAWLPGNMAARGRVAAGALGCGVTCLLGRGAAWALCYICRGRPSIETQNLVLCDEQFNWLGKSQSMYRHTNRATGRLFLHHMTRRMACARSERGRILGRGIGVGTVKKAPSNGPHIEREGELFGRK